MSREEQRQADESPNRLKFGQAMGASRFARTMAVYYIVDELREKPQAQHEEIILSYAELAGTSPEAMKVDLGWARKINEKDLRWAFNQEGISDTQWCQRIGLGHLRTVARAEHPNGLGLSSEERVAWLVGCYHAAEGAGAFEDRLRAGGYLPVRKVKRFGAEDGAKEAERIIKGREAAAYVARCLAGDYGLHVQAKIAKSWERRAESLNGLAPIPDTAMTFLEALADAARTAGIDVALPKIPQAGHPYNLAKTLRSVAELLDQTRPGAEFAIGGGEREAEVPTDGIRPQVPHHD